MMDKHHNPGEWHDFGQHQQAEKARHRFKRPPCSLERSSMRLRISRNLAGRVVEDVGEHQSY